MDAFQLLTRSTRLKSVSGKLVLSKSSHLPSAGEAENPRLFHPSKDITFSENKKDTKKRKMDEFNDGDGFDSDLFSARHVSTSSGPPTSEHRNRDYGEEAHQQDVPDQEDVMDKARQRSVLKEHRIKVTDLRDLEEIQLKSTGGLKRRKRGKSTALTRKQQKQARQLYPEPLVSFRQLRERYRTSKRLSDNIAEQGFLLPTEVQMGSLPLLLGNGIISGNSHSVEVLEPDLLVIAPTGSGKTLAFLIPAINKIVRYHHENPGLRETSFIIVAPTKELVSQIVNEGRKLALGTGVKITAMKKGMRVVDYHDDDRMDETQDGASDSDFDGSAAADDDYGDESLSRKRSSRNTITKSDILVTTPLLLVNTLSADQTKDITPIPSVRNIVLDEADILLDPLFREQTFKIWTACTHSQLRVSLWSATMGSNVEELARRIIKERQISLGITDRTPLIRVVIGLKDSAVPNIAHKLIYAATEQGKLLGLRQLLHPTAPIAPSEIRLQPPFLIFTQTIPRAVALHSELLYDIPAEAGGSSRIAVLHSDLSETRRSEIMKGFRKGEIWVIVTTDLLARGVDFRGINGVVNYDIPTSSAAYVHRVGRTGRAGREGGVAVTFYTKEDIPYVKSIANLISTSEKLRNQSGEKSVQKWLLDSLPDLSKQDRRELKRHGVKARQSSDKNVGEGRTRISTKSGFERRVENNRKGAIAASRKTKFRAISPSKSDDASWGGFEE